MNHVLVKLIFLFSAEIVHTSVFDNYLRFLISGGLNFKKILPDIFLIPHLTVEQGICNGNLWINFEGGGGGDEEV